MSRCANSRADSRKVSSARGGQAEVSRHREDPARRSRQRNRRAAALTCRRGGQQGESPRPRGTSSPQDRTCRRRRCAKSQGTASRSRARRARLQAVRAGRPRLARCSADCRPACNSGRALRRQRRARGRGQARRRRFSDRRRREPHQSVCDATRRSARRRKAPSGEPRPCRQSATRTCGQSGA